MATISAETLREWLDQGKPVTIVDVRPAAERAEWAIPGSLHIDAYKKLREGDPNALAGLEVPPDKPVVAVMDTVAASGGYITAIASDYIVARGNTITGSIGVIFSFPEISKLLDTLGIKMEEIKSGELKAEPSPYKPVSDRVRQVSNEMVLESFAWFTGLVVERRKLSPERVKILADGRVYTGRQAITEKLIDALGGEEVGLDWLQTQKNVPKNLEIVEWRNPPNADPSGLGFSAANTVLKALGFEGLRRQVESARLDGLLVLWHPQL